MELYLATDGYDRWSGRLSKPRADRRDGPLATFEGAVRKTGRNYTYYVPVTPEMLGKELEAVVLLLKGGNPKIQPEVWLTTYPIPFVSKELVLDI